MSQRLLLDLLYEILQSLESADIKVEEVMTTFVLIQKSNEQLFAALLTYLAQLSLILNPTHLRGRLVAQVHST